MKFELFGRKIAFFAYPGQWEKLKLLCTAYFLHPASISAFALLLLGVAFYQYGKFKHKPSAVVWAKRYIPALYLLLIVALSLLNRSPGTRGSFHLRFDFVFGGTVGVHETRILMAVFDFLYYIPYGFLLRWFHPKGRTYGSLLFASATGLTMEICQWLFGLGVGTVEHWLLYTCGAATGVVLFSLRNRSIKNENSDRGQG